MRPWTRGRSMRWTRSPRRVGVAAVGRVRVTRRPLPAGDGDDLDRRRQFLPIGIRRLLNLADDVHAPNDAAERGEALAVGVAAAAKVERRLIVDEDEEAGGGGIG